MLSPTATDQAPEPSTSTTSPFASEAELAAPRRGLWHGCSACLASMAVHAVLLILLGVLAVDERVREEVRLVVAEMLEPRPEELLSIELDQQPTPATEPTSALTSSLPQAGAAGETAAAYRPPALDAAVVDQSATTEVAIDDPLLSLPPTTGLIDALPEGALLGDARAVVDDYQEALDRITQEIMWMLDRGEVLVVWCFDQSGSMKDDQQEIRERVERVYVELGLTESTGGDALSTAITSFGSTFQVHTRRPTSDLDEIRLAIDAVPTDKTGQEQMCEAVGRAIAQHSPFARSGRRQMALILVTDESGELDSNVRLLEATIAEAKAARCKVYTLGREAIFGYPFGHIRWRHPQTQRIHWLPINRGPETAFVEQLQTDGFRRRHDAFSSGFGPYEQTRLCRETGGIFFMLPSVETNLVRGEKRRYELEAMRAYKPDLRARQEVLSERDSQPLRTLLWKVITDLNPYNPQSSRVVEMRVQFSPDPAEFVKQVRVEQQKAVMLIRYFGEAEKQLIAGASLREQEASPRWQANYDLMLAQIVAYQARLYEYGAALEAFVQKPDIVPLQKPPNLRLVNWDITTRKETLAEDVSGPYIDRASEMFKAVAKVHPGTPWAARAEWELRRGFGVKLVPDYDPPYRKVANPIPAPKL